MSKKLKCKRHKTSDELNAAALQTNIGDNLIKENLPREDLKIEELHFSGKGQHQSIKAFRSQIQKFKIKLLSCLFDEENESSDIGSQIETLNAKISKSCSDILEQVLQTSTIDIEATKGDEVIYEFNPPVGKICKFYIAWGGEVSDPVWKEIYKKLDSESSVAPFISLQLYLDKEGQLFETEGTGTKISCFCVVWDKLQDSHSDIKAKLTKLQSMTTERNTAAKKIK
eukprot:GHVP01022085.1.p1 GENE.GHVP01022085.1~~GHVP01022085.1.p1  ORF type:complete len:227 (+),score=46.23 GHVP01022085.1:107-787(+)